MSSRHRRIVSSSASFRSTGPIARCVFPTAAHRLTSTEFDLLWALVCRAGEVVSRKDLTLLLRGIEFDGFDRSIDGRISKLRRKLRDDLTEPKRIKTIRGKGYQFSKHAWD